VVYSTHAPPAAPSAIALLIRLHPSSPNSGSTKSGRSASSIRSTPPWIFFRIYTTNNHPLNTLFVWMIGHQSAWYVYRLPSLVAGLGSVALAWRRSWIFAVFVAFRLPLGELFTEARGYGLAVFFLLLAMEAKTWWCSACDDPRNPLSAGYPSRYPLLRPWRWHIAPVIFLRLRLLLPTPL